MPQQVFNSKEEALAAWQGAHSDYGQTLANEAYQSGTNLYDPKVLAQLRDVLGPYFQQQAGQLSRQRLSSMNQAGQSAGAQAAFQGVSGAAFAQSARQRAGAPYASAFGALTTDQLKTLIDATASSQAFKSSNLLELLKIHTGFDMQNRANPTIWEQIFSGIIGGGAKIGAAAIGKP